MIVSSNQKSELFCLVCHSKGLVFSIFDIPFKIFKINSEHDIISGCQTVRIAVSKPELAAQISKAIFVG